MENYLEALPTIIKSRLLAESDVELARLLGYKNNGHTTIARIKNNKTGQQRINDKLISRFNKAFGITTNTILRMAKVVEGSVKLRQIIRRHFNLKDSDLPFKVLLAFVSHDFSNFDLDFKNNILPEINLTEQMDPEALYLVLSLFYIEEERIEVYKRNSSVNEMAATICENLCEKLISLSYENVAAATWGFIHSIFSKDQAATSNLWDVIYVIAKMLQSFANPIGSIILERNNLKKLNNVGTRSYWQGENTGEAILTWYYPGPNNSTGIYYIFKISRDRNIQAIYSNPFDRIHYEGWMIFLEYEKENFALILPSTITDKGHIDFEIAEYNWNGMNFHFTFDRPHFNPLKTGDNWELLDIKYSKDLLEFDRNLSENFLLSEIIKAMGLEIDNRFQINDVILSRQRFSLKMQSGELYSISVSEFPFIRKISPFEKVLVVIDKEDNITLVFWPLYSQIIPLDRFTREQ